MSLAWKSIPDLVATAARLFGPREAVADGSLRLSFAELSQRVQQAARATIAAGIDPGDRVAIWAPNTWEWIVAALGAVSAGGVLVPINTRFKGREAGFVLRKSGTRLLLTTTGFLDTDYVALLRDAGETLDDLEATVVIRGKAHPGMTVWQEFLARGDAVAPQDADRRGAAVSPDDLSDVIFTSGTTGRPKGAMATHGQTLRVFEVWSRLVGLREGDRYLVVNPFFHTFGYKAGILACLMRGATILPHAVFDAPSVLKVIAQERVSVLPGPPTLYQSILNVGDRGDLSSLRLAVTGAAVVPVELIHRMRRELTFETILTAYGLTEATGVVTMCDPGDDAETIARTSGCAIPDTEVKVVDDEGREVARGEPGEVVVRGYNVMRGYLDDTEETAKAIDSDGFLHTGDVGEMDERGYLRITDRKKDMFIVGGFNAYPAEIENELLRHPKVAQVAIVGVPDERLGEVGAAFVVPRTGKDLNAEELISWARQQIANFKVPRRVEIVESLPVNASGKVLKYELRERARAALQSKA
jgi:HIP---CoA ligase